MDVSEELPTQQAWGMPSLLELRTISRAKTQAEAQPSGPNGAVSGSSQRCPGIGLLLKSGGPKKGSKPRTLEICRVEALRAGQASFKCSAKHVNTWHEWRKNRLNSRSLTCGRKPDYEFW